MMILGLGAPVSITRISWMAQYLKEFDLTIEEMKSMKCNQPFIFGPSKRYLSQTLVEFPVLVTRLDGKEDVLVIQTYLVDAEVPFLCGKQTLENWNFRIDSRDKILEIESKTDGSQMKIKMIDMSGGHYAVVLMKRKKQNSSILLLEDANADVPVLVLEDTEGDLCSFKDVRKVYKVNRHKKKE